MPQDIVSAPLGEVRVSSTADGGTALTTTAAFVAFPVGTDYVILTPRNFSTAVVCKYSLNPFLTVLKTTDALVAASNITDGSKNVQDGDTGTSLSLNSFSTAANSDFIYVGSHIPFRGVRVIIGNTNAGSASVLTVKYRKSDNTWADISVTDGTSSGGKTFAQTGNVTWTLPTDWIARSLVSIGDTTLVAPAILNEPEMYWTRWETDVVFDSTVTATGMLAMNRVTTYDEIPAGMSADFRIKSHQHRGIGCVEALTDAGTANLIVSVAVTGVGGKFA